MSTSCKGRHLTSCHHPGTFSCKTIRIIYWGHKSGSVPKFLSVLLWIVYSHCTLVILNMPPANVQATSLQTYLWWVQDCYETYKVIPGSLTTNLPIVGEGVDARELPKLLLLMKPFTAVPLVIPADDSPPFKASINAVNSCLKKNKVRGDFYPAVLSISWKFWLWV